MKKEKEQYTEKVTVRLTEADKERLQIKADELKLPLTTLIRNLASGIPIENNEIKEFKPQKIATDYETFERDNRLTNLKVNSFNAVISEAKKLIQLPDPTSDLYKKFVDNPVLFVTDILYNTHSKGITFKISPTKLLELMEIDLSDLKSAYQIYSNSKGSVIIDENGNLKSGVKIEHYTSYTTCEADNNRLKLSNDLIDIFKQIRTVNSSITHGLFRSFFSHFLQLDSLVYSETGLSPREGWVLGR